MGIQSPGNRAPALLDHFLGKPPRFGFILEFSGRANDVIAVFALRRYIRTIGNVPDIAPGHVIGLKQVQHLLPRKAVLDAIIYFSGVAPVFLELGQKLRNSIDRGDALAALLHLVAFRCCARIGLAWN
jgi:hypothetical protein